MFLTHGTTEERLDFVSVFQSVPHTGKHFQRGCITANKATYEEGKGGEDREMDATRDKGGEGRIGGGRESGGWGGTINIRERNRKDTHRTAEESSNFVHAEELPVVALTSNPPSDVSSGLHSGLQDGAAPP